MKNEIHTLADLAEAVTEELEQTPGVWHAVRDGLTVPGVGARLGTPGRTLLRGDNVLVDDELIEAARGRDGYSPLEHLDDDEQIQQWGVVFLREGELANNPTLVEQLARDAEQLVLETKQYNARNVRQVSRVL